MILRKIEEKKRKNAIKEYAFLLNISTFTIYLGQAFHFILDSRFDIIYILLLLL